MSTQSLLIVLSILACEAMGSSLRGSQHARGPVDNTHRALQFQGSGANSVFGPAPVGNWNPYKDSVKQGDEAMAVEAPSSPNVDKQQMQGNPVNTVFGPAPVGGWNPYNKKKEEEKEEEGTGSSSEADKQQMQGNPVNTVFGPAPVGGWNPYSKDMTKALQAPGNMVWPEAAAIAADGGNE